VRRSVPVLASCCGLETTTLPNNTSALAVLTAAAPSAAAILAAWRGWSRLAAGPLTAGGARCGEPMRTLSSGQVTSDGTSEQERGASCSVPDGQMSAGPAEVGWGFRVAGPSVLVVPSSAERAGAPVTTSRASGGAAQRGRPRQGPASIRTSSGTCPGARFRCSGSLHL
jgi:hypothetical protein